MPNREQLSSKLWERLAAVPNVAFTARNPKAEPSAADLPAIQFFELEDVVEDVSKRGGLPVYKRRLTVAVESFISAASEGASSKEILDFVSSVKKSIYGGDASLGKGSEIRERELTRILRPPTGANVVGLGLVLDIIYVEDISKL